MRNFDEIYVEGHKLIVHPINPAQFGPPIYLFHGIHTSISFWSPELLAPFREFGPCYLVSLPGHYPASFPEHFNARQLTPELLARLLTAVIQHTTGDQKAILVGHSTGGFAILNIAAHAPELVKSVISISGFAHGKWTGLLGKYQWLARQGKIGRVLFKQCFKFAYLRPVYKATAPLYCAKYNSMSNYPYTDKVIDNGNKILKQLSLDQLIQYFEAMPNINITPQLRKIQQPALILTGSQDPIVAPEQSRLICQQIPTAELIEIDQVGHLPFFEAPQIYNQAIKTFLAKQRQDIAAPTLNVSV